MLFIAHLLLAAVSYIAIMLALNIGSIWLAGLFLATLIYSIFGFSHYMAKASTNSLDRSKYLPVVLTYYSIYKDDERTSRAHVKDVDGNQICRNWLDAEQLRSLVERRALATELPKPLPRSEEYEVPGSYRQKFVLPAKLTIAKIDDMTPKSHSK